MADASAPGFDDLARRREEIDRDLLLLPRGDVFTRRQVMLAGGVAVLGFTLLVALMVVAILGVRDIAQNTQATTESTNKVVSEEIPRLERTIAQQNDVIGQATDAIVQLQQLLRENGIEPPEIVIRSEEEEPG